MTYSHLSVGLVMAVAMTLADSTFAADAAPTRDGEIVVTGDAVPDLVSFDSVMLSFMKEHHVPGGAIAVGRRGKVVYARGFGLADQASGRAVQPGDLFRIASISKPITAVAILQLAEQGKLRLDQPVLEVLKFDPALAPNQPVDARWKSITIRELLQHRGGFDRDKSFDPMFRTIDIAKTMGVEPPPTQRLIMRYMMDKPLDFAPGEGYAYSNFGYCVLGRVIEDVTGESYEAYVRKHVLAPVGVKDMAIGHTLPLLRGEHEVTYYARGAEPRPRVVGAPIGQPVNPPDGAWHLEAMDSHGGWIASAPDLVRFAMAFDDPDHSPLLKRASIEAMFARPPGVAGLDNDGKPKAAYYGCGWSVRPVGDKANTWHAGGLDGTSTLLVRRHDGLTWAALFNSDRVAQGHWLAHVVDGYMHAAADAVKHWPE